MDKITNLLDLSSLGGVALTTAGVVAVGALVYQDDVIAKVANNKILFGIVYFFTGLGLGYWIQNAGFRAAI